MMRPTAIMMPRTRITPPLRDGSVERMSHSAESAAAKPAKVAAATSPKVSAAAPTSSVSE